MTFLRAGFISFSALLVGSVLISLQCSFGASFLLPSQEQIHARALLVKDDSFLLSVQSCCNLGRRRRKTAGLLQAAARNSREDEIRRKIAKLKRDGKIKNEPSIPQDDGRGISSTPVSEQYGRRLAQKLGSKKAKRLGLLGDEDDADALIAELDADEEGQKEGEENISNRRQAQLGPLPKEEGDDEQDENERSKYVPPMETTASQTTEYKNYNPDLFGDDGDGMDENKMSEEELIELVANKLAEKRRIEEDQKEERRREAARNKIDELLSERKEAQLDTNTGKTTSGVGGRWMESNATKVDIYKPKTGSWGYFERPKDISKAYGGGKRVGVGYTPDTLTRQKSEEGTRERLQQYRERVGIDVQSEKDHAAEIERALDIGKRAMERGVYSAAVSALEQVTKWCSTNSPVGGKVFLELAMAYEAVGRTNEAITVYTTLTRSRMEDIKFNAKRLLYGIEAMQFMQNEARNPEFSRKKIRSTFIDTTGLANIASNFDDVYQTAYIDLSRNYYKQLTESVVRTNREARQILLKATGAGEVERLKVVQALRSISRNFDDALEEEIQNNKPASEPVAIMDGKPIIAQPQTTETDEVKQMVAAGLDEYILASPEQMMENLDGEWRLQLLADKRGDGVKYYNNSISWQRVDTKRMTFSSKGSAGFLTVSQSGGIEFQDKRRILKRTDLDISGTGGLLSGFLSKGPGGSPGAVSTPQQIVSVDSVLLITRLAPSKKKKYDDSTKDYFAVWRRVEPGTFAASP